jgi:hypothetical protein
MGSVAGIMEEFGGVKQGLGGDATDVQARTAKLVAFDKRNSHPELRGTDCSQVASGSRPQDGKVEFLSQTPSQGPA